MNQVSLDQNETNLRGGAGARTLEQRVDQARDIVDNVRDRAEVAFRDRPYLVPVAAGVLGLGIGVLFGSRITRFIVFTAVGSLLSDQFGGELKRLGSSLVENLQQKLEDAERPVGGEGQFTGE
jgi:tetrahydromethanopterin S-methyltransferase subunit F